MIAKCEICGFVFESKNGGSICQGKCQRTFCPKCEERHFGDDEKGFAEDVCLKCQGKPLKPDSRQVKRAKERTDLWNKNPNCFFCGKPTVLSDDLASYRTVEQPEDRAVMFTFPDKTLLGGTKTIVCFACRCSRR